MNENQVPLPANTKPFHIGDILSVTTGCLVSPRGIAGVYDILNYLTGEDLYTHQLPRAMRACRPALIAAFPQLAAADMRGVTPYNHDARLAAAVATYGETLPVATLARGTYARQEPIAELLEMTDKPIIVIAEEAR